MNASAPLIFCVAIAAVLTACGEEPAYVPMPPQRQPAPEPVVIPGPAPIKESIDEQARGLYVLKRGSLRFSLDLQEGGVFRFFSTREGGDARSANGTWEVTKRGLALTYTHQDDRPLPGGPETVVNKWRGDRIELQDTGLTPKPVLVRRQMIRLR